MEPPAESADVGPTTRVRIRDAALGEFARHGVSGTTIRGIAATAGVSPALVQYAAVVTAMNLGIVMLHEHLARRLGAGPLTGEGYPRVGRALLDIHADVLLGPEVIAKARSGLEHLRAGPQATTAQPAPAEEAVMPEPLQFSICPPQRWSDPGHRDGRLPASEAAARKTDSDPPA